MKRIGLGEVVILVIHLCLFSCHPFSQENHSSISKRSPSQTENLTTSTLMKEGFVRTFFAIKDPQDLDEFLVLLEKNYSSFTKKEMGEVNIFRGLQQKLNIKVWDGKRNPKDREADFKREKDVMLAAALFIPLRESRGIIWRLHPLSDSVDFTQTRIVAQIVSMISAARVFSSYNVKNQAQGITDALMDYITQPWFGKSELSLPQIKSARELQKFVEFHYIDVIEKTLKRIKGIQIDDKNQILFDAELALNSNVFDPDYRYASIGTVEKMEILASLHLAQHYSKIFVGTNIDQLKGFTKELTQSLVLGGNKYFFPSNGERGKLFNGKGEFGESLYDMTYGHRPLDMAIILAKAKYKDLFKVRVRQYYLEAFDHLKEFVNLTSKVVDHTTTNRVNLIQDVKFYFNPFRILKFDHESKRLTQKALRNIKMMIKDEPGFIVNNITGEEITVKVKSLYSDIEDFKLLVPGLSKRVNNNLTLDTSYYRKIDTTLRKRYPQSIRDYRAGQPIKWNYSILRKVFPKFDESLPDRLDEDRVKLHLRTLSQSFGAVAFLLPMLSQF